MQRLLAQQVALVLPQALQELPLTTQVVVVVHQALLLVLVG
jgi:hypothetical protein